MVDELEAKIVFWAVNPLLHAETTSIKTSFLPVSRAKFSIISYSKR